MQETAVSERRPESLSKLSENNKTESTATSAENVPVTPSRTFPVPYKSDVMLMQSFLAGHGFTSCLHSTALHNNDSCYNAVSQFFGVCGIPLTKSKALFPLHFFQVLKLFILKLHCFFFLKKLVMTEP